jgi:hypothetical protein
MAVACKRFVLSGRGLYHGPIPPLEGSYRVCESLRVIRCNSNCYTYDEQVDRGRDKEKRKNEGWTVHSDVLEGCSKTDLILGNLGT